MYTLSINMWFQKLIRQFFFNLDKVVYGFITTIYDLLISIARTSVLSQADIINMADKIYKLLAVFMVFKVTFSLIMYVVNPDDFSDKSKGVSKLGLNIVISLALLILVPYMFSAAFRLQTIILEDNSLAELIMGNGNDKEQNSSFLNDVGDTIAFYSIQPFFLPNVSLEGLDACININDDCFTAMEKLTGSNFNSTLLNNYKYGIENENFGLMFRQDLAIATDKGNDNFIMDYRFILSTVLGVVIVLILITFCMDVALRSIKLSFLQLIAPIPIISYVDPKSGKDGMFKKWYQMCFKTYASLFLRLIALYFAVYIISRVGKLTDIVDGSQVTNGFIKIFIIIGALMFAKQLPKILEGLGIKLDSGFKLNPLKKFEEEALGGKRITGAAGGMVAGIVGGHGVGGRIAGAFTGAARGFATNKGYAGGISRQADVNRKMREARINGAGFWGSHAAILSNRYGLDDMDLEREAKQLHDDKIAVDMATRQIDALNKPRETAKKELQARIAPQQSLIQKKQKVRDSIKDMEDFAVKQIESNKAGAVSDEYRRRKATHEYLSANQGRALAYDVNIDGRQYHAGDMVTADMVSEADNSVGLYLNKIGKQSVMDSLLTNSYHDASAQAMFDTKRQTYINDVDVYNAEETDASQRINAEGTYDNIHSQGDTVDISVQQKKQSIRAEEVEIERLDREIKETQVSQTVEVDGRTMTVEEAQNDVSTREKSLKDRQERRKINREMAKNRQIRS